MCGIAGILSANPNLVFTSRIRAGISSLEHRGPDAEGQYMEENIAMAHMRLSIIDLSDNASQPFVYMERYHLIYNGEIYNYRELRSELQKKNFQFRTISDTEVLVINNGSTGLEQNRRFQLIIDHNSA